MSDQRIKQNVDQAVIETWLVRYRDLESRLTDRSDGEWAWLWRVRRDILHYLINRYAPRCLPDRINHVAEQAPSPTQGEPESVAGYTRSVAGVSTVGPTAYPPRAGGTFRVKLEHLRSINDKVRAEYPAPGPFYAYLDPRDLIIRTTYPEGLYGQQHEQLGGIETSVVSRELEGIREYLALNGHTSGGETPLTEREILSILTGQVHGYLDSHDPSHM